jgi:membrane-bound metal-dependent hydrolase YbcI (DUF457 family)
VRGLSIRAVLRLTLDRGHGSPWGRKQWETNRVIYLIVETYSHAFFTGVLARYGFKASPAATTASMVGAVLPDLPALVATAYYWNSRNSMPRKELVDAIYLTGPFGRAGVLLHSAVLVGLLLGLYWLVGLWERDRCKILLWFLIGWAGHTMVDFLTHSDDARPLFWPISDWKWASPISYYDPLHYGREFFFVEHGAILLTILLLLARWIIGQRRHFSKVTVRE